MENTESIDRGRLFLDKFSKLENLIERSFRVGSESPILYLARRKEFAQYYEQLNYCREVRNILSHNPRFEDEYIVSPSEAMLDFLDDIINLLDRPLLAKHVCTPVGALTLCYATDRLLPLIVQMQRKGLSHSPVMDNGRIIGVFSRASLFAYIANGGSPDQHTRVSALASYLDFDNGQGVYAFAHEKDGLLEVQSLFEQSYKNKGKLSVVFLTNDGTKQGRLTGLVTPADLLKKPNRNTSDKKNR